MDIHDSMVSKRLDIKMRGIVNNIVFSKNEVWAYYAVNTSSYDFMNEGSKVIMLSSMSQTFANMMAGKDERIDMHLIITNTPVNIDHWESQFLEASESWDKKPGFNKYFAQQVEYLKTRGYMNRRVYIGIKLMNRHEITLKNVMQHAENGGVGNAIKYIKDVLSTPTGNEYDIEDKEIKSAQSMEVEYYNFYHGSEMAAERATSEEIALIMKRAFYPAMPTPFLDVPVENNKWGKSDMIRELGADMKRSHKWVEITQPVDGEMLTGYRATLTFSKFPESMTIPPSIPWIYLLQKMGFSYDVYARFTLIPNKKMKKEVSHQKMDLEDEGANASESGHNVSLDLQEDYSKAMELEAYTNKNDNPWLEGTYRIVVTDNDIEDLEQTIEVLKNAYSGNGITLTWTTGDQLDLMLEYMPGDSLRDKSFVQTSSVELIGASGFNIFNKVGDDDMVA